MLTLPNVYEKSTPLSDCLTQNCHGASRTMDPPESAWSQACICGRIFSVPQAYTFHRRSCPKAKKRLSDALAKANEVWQVKKRRKLEGMAQHSQPVECRSNSS